MQAVNEELWNCDMPTLTRPNVIIARPISCITAPLKMYCDIAPTTSQAEARRSWSSQLATDNSPKRYSHWYVHFLSSLFTLRMQYRVGSPRDEFTQQAGFATQGTYPATPSPSAFIIYDSIGSFSTTSGSSREREEGTNESGITSNGCSTQ
jgi:hypothetical protein